MASNFLEILSQLHDHHVEFVIVGGVAASLHGGSRVTFDLDVVPSLAQESWQAAVDLLWSLGARPRIPEPLDRIRDAEQVRRWRTEKGMLALNFRAPMAKKIVSSAVHVTPLGLPVWAITTGAPPVTATRFSCLAWK